MHAVLLKILAFFLSLLNMIFPNIGLFANINQIHQPEAHYAYEEADPTERLAAAAANRVNAVYGDSERNAYVVANDQVRFMHMLKGKQKTAWLTSVNGKAYAEDTFRTFFTTDSEKKRFFEGSDGNVRSNTTRFGIYYYENNIRNLTADGFYVDKKLHAYADRMYLQFRLLSDKPTQELSSFGTEIKLPAAKVAAVKVAVNGEEKDVCGSETFENASYIAFDIRGVGVFALIPAGDTVSKLELKKSATYYTLYVYANYTPGAGLNDYKEEGGFDLNEVTFGMRLYTDETHSFEGVKKAAYEETHPLAVTVAENASGAAFVGYNPLRGLYEITMNGTGFNEAFADPSLRFSAPFTVKNGGDDRAIFVDAACLVSGGLECGVVLDADGRQLAMDTQVSKNFQGDGGEWVYSAPDRQYSDMIFPVMAKAGAEESFTAVHLYQNWGDFPLKQISSIEYHTPYYHLSTGVTETNCISMQYMSDVKDGMLLPDFRTMSAPFWGHEPQHNSTGILKFMAHRNDRGEFFNTYSGSKVSSTGPTYADVTNYYTDDLGCFKYSLRHLEMPQTDENRTYMTLDVEFTKRTTYKNFRQDFDLFYFNSRGVVLYKSAFYTGEGEKTVITDAGAPGSEVYYKLEGKNPMMGYLETTPESVAAQEAPIFGCNFALIVRSASLISGGNTKELPLLFRNIFDGALNIGRLTADYDRVTFHKGDRIVIDLILLPFGDNMDPDVSHAEKVRLDSAIEPLTAVATKGTVVTDAYVPTVVLDKGEAAFTLTGGANNTAVKLTGLSARQAPAVYAVSENGDRTRLDITGWDFGIGDDGKYTATFVTNLDEVRSFECIE